MCWCLSENIAKQQQLAASPPQSKVRALPWLQPWLRGFPWAGLHPRASGLSLGPARAQDLDLHNELLARRPVPECPSPLAFLWVCSVGFASLP